MPDSTEKQILVLLHSTRDGELKKLAVGLVRHLGATILQAATVTEAEKLISGASNLMAVFARPWVFRTNTREFGSACQVCHTARKFFATVPIFLMADLNELQTARGKVTFPDGAHDVNSSGSSFGISIAVRKVLLGEE